MKIYTKTGDKGKTSLIGGCLVAKSDLRIEAFGTVDELNSYLGVIHSLLNLENSLPALRLQVQRIQNELFNLGSLLACEDPSLLSKLPVIQQLHILRLESEIDEMTTQLAPLKNFILPGGHLLAAQLHFARSLCRRAERMSVKLYDQHREIEMGMVYLNRLSDWLFTAARFANQHFAIADQLWEK